MATRLRLSLASLRRSEYTTQQALDECYMQIALDLGLTVLAKHPIEVRAPAGWASKRSSSRLVLQPRPQPMTAPTAQA